MSESSEIARRLLAELQSVENGECPDSIDAEILAEHDGDVFSAWISDVLEIFMEGRKPLGGEWDVTRVGVLVGYGGPSIRVFADGDGWVEVVVNWWDDNATERAYLPGVDARIFEIGEYA